MKNKIIIKTSMAITLLFAIMFSAAAQTPVKTTPILRNSFVAVTSISGVPATTTVGTLTLTGTVKPDNATNKTIAWSVVSAGTTGAKISGNTLTTAAAGTVTIRATIKNGTADNKDYTQNFSITVNAASKVSTVRANLDLEATAKLMEKGYNKVTLTNATLYKVLDEDFTILEEQIVIVKKGNSVPLTVKSQFKGKNLTWKSDDETVATVAPSGNVTAKYPSGDKRLATITVTTQDGVKSQCLVYVVTDKIASTSYAVGKGIDVTVATAVAPPFINFNNPVFDIELLYVSDRLKKSDNFSDDFKWEMHSGETVEEMMDKFTTKNNVNYKGYFTASVDVNYNSQDKVKRTTGYARVRAEVRVRDEWMEGTSNLQDLNKFVTSNFKADLKSKTAKQMLDAYGSHVIAKCYWGGVAQLDIISSSTTINASSKLAVVAKASAFGVSGSSDNVSESEKNEFSKNSKITISARGGTMDATSNEEFYKSFSQWVNRVRTQNRAVVCGIDDFNEYQNLIPIWEVARIIDPSKANAIKAEFDIKAQNNKGLFGKITNITPVITEVQAKSKPNPVGTYTIERFLGDHTNIVLAKETDRNNHIAAVRELDEKWKNEDYNGYDFFNCNWGHRTLHQVQITYKAIPTTRYVTDRAITDIMVVHNTQKAKAESQGYTIQPYDLHAGSNQPQHIIWLAVKRAKSDNDEVIDFIGGYYTDSWSNIKSLPNPDKYGRWEWVKAFAPDGSISNPSMLSMQPTGTYLVVHKTKNSYNTVKK